MATRDRTVTVAIITGIVTLLLGCCLGSLAGSFGGYFIGRQAAAGPTGGAAPEIPRLLTPGAARTPTPPRLQIPQTQIAAGAVLQEVIAGSPAEQAGLKPGDVITAVNNTPINQNHRLVDIVGLHKPGDQVTLRVRRAGEALTLKATLGENPDQAGRPYLGVRYADLGVPGATPLPGD